MEQEITVSENIFNYLSNNIKFGRNDASDCVDIIDDNFIIDDNDNTIFKSFSNSIDAIAHSKLTEFNKLEFIKEILTNWTKNNRRELKSVNKNDWGSDILKLCELSEDKIYFNPDLESKEIKKLTKKHLQIESHNANSFINPDISSRLKHIPLILKFEKDIFYNINNILLPFIRNAKNIAIIEPYIYRWQNFINFKKFSEIIPKSIPCKIKLLRNSSKDDKTKQEITIFNDFINDSNRNGYDYVLEYFMLPPNKSTKHIERHIRTDKYQIYMPGGFNCINENGYANITDDDDIKEIKVNKL